MKAARARGEDLTGPDDLLQVVPATVLVASLLAEMTEHLGARRSTMPQPVARV